MGQTAELDLKPAASDNPVASAFLSCLGKAGHMTSPFDHWLLEKPLPDTLCDEILNLPFDPPKGAVFGGKREINNKLRVYFTPENQARFDACKQVVSGFKDLRVIRAIEHKTGTDLSDTRLRIEYCQDTEGFWLEPHTDIFVKKFTMLVYLSDDPTLVNAGTDIHEGPPDFRYVHSAPYGKNVGVIFIPGKNSWHGVGHHPVKGIRKSIIINYVAPQWRDTWELA